MTLPRASSRKVIPVTLITGFLGAGKTTLVNNMLRDAQGLRLAVLVNDFGAVNIDAELIETSAEEVISLKNGCICCSLTGGLLAAINGVLRRADTPDAIIIEGSGIAEPFEVASALSDPELQRYAPLDGIVTVVDATGICDLDGEALNIAIRQIAMADLVLLNKTDLIDEQKLELAENKLKQIAPDAKLVRSQNSDVPLSVLLGLAFKGLATNFQCDSVELSKGPLETAFESFVIERFEPIGAQKLHDLISQLPERVYRVKGVIHLAERPEVRCILQSTGKRAAITIGEAWRDRNPCSQIVFIAAKGALTQSFVENRLGGSSVT